MAQIKATFTRRWALRPTFWPMQQQQRIIYLYPDQTYTFGRSRKADILLPSSACSANHCSIQVFNNHLILIDTSRNGTYINNQLAPPTGQRLSIGDEISFGVRPDTPPRDNENRLVFSVTKFYEFCLGVPLTEPPELTIDLTIDGGDTDEEN